MANYVLFISEEKLKDTTSINQSVDVEYLLASIRTAQKKYIETKLGTDLFQKLQSDITGSSLTGAYETLVEDYIGDALAWWSLYEAMPFLRYKIMNNNVVSMTAENSETLSREEAQDLREECRNNAEFYTERLIDYIKHNVSDYPEYSTNTGADVTPDSNAFYSGMNLEHDRNKRKEITLDDFLTPDLK
ncbi:MAG: hypothetical protein GOVbin3264_45 [Prokaryotic dsDNA virus sp.]|nr:MAG: hypothetical protein GOVbin3264_45 [Prokaryotic dsDNA virus sp.]|tara:strand:- start:4845 stop:5411 length:567 start_codon:yes stop_codon:yes gene_type:complete